MSHQRTPQNAPIKVWDFPIRIFHWGLVTAIVTSWVSIKTDNIETHVISGACILGLLIFRLLWGIWGASTAQFHRFIPSPRALLNYLRSDAAEPRIGHSPIAALSVVAMLVVLSIQVLTGLVADDDVYTTGPLVAFVESDFSEWATGMHSTNSDILLGLMALHLVAILFYKLIKKRSLAKAMITGYGDQLPEPSNPLQERSYIVFLLTAALSALVPYMLFNLL